MYPFPVDNENGQNIDFRERNVGKEESEPEIPNPS